MNEAIAISIKQVGKAYRIWDTPLDRLHAPLMEAMAGLLPAKAAFAQSLRSKAERKYHDFWALKHVDFEVRKGESIGIIGRNGSGKSTLLQIIAGTLQPTTGSVTVNGRVAALLELGSGFNPEFTGRENVYLNGAVLGLTRQKVTDLFAEIAAFADIGEFIDQPVKTYSSGMMMRLAFAVQTAVNPDILIIDEALSVGDAPFQAKCFARLRAIQSRGCSVLFVSHDLGTVRTFCQQALWLSSGLAQAQGNAIDVCEAYNRDCLRAMGMNFSENPFNATGGTEVAEAGKSSYLLENRAEFTKLAAQERRGNGRVQIRNFFFNNQNHNRTSVLSWDETVTAVYVLGTDTGYEGCFQCGLVCKTIQGQELLCCSDRTHELRLRLAPGEECAVTMSTKLPLRAGQYLVTVGLFLFPDDARYPTGTYDFTRATVADFIPCGSVVNIPPQFNLGIHGPVQMESQLNFPAT